MNMKDNYSVLANLFLMKIRIHAAVVYDIFL